MDQHAFAPREFADCADHAVAFCRPCQRDYRFAELAYAALAPQPFLRCPRCRTDVTESLSLHLQHCAQASRRRTAGRPPILR